jgi:hypothetical protein
MEKTFSSAGVTVVKVLGEVLFLYGLLGWIYGVTIELTNPSWLALGLSHLTVWIRVDTFAVLSFLLSLIGFFMWRLAKESVSITKSGRVAKNDG